MIRAAFLRPTSTSTTATITMFTTAASRAPKNNNAGIVRYFTAGKPSPSSVSPSNGPLHLAKCNINPNRAAITASRMRMMALRSTSSSTNQKDTKTQTGAGAGAEDPMSQEIMLTPGEKVVAGTRLFVWAGAAAFASVCAYYIGKELLPTKMSPNTVFDKASSLIHQNAEVKRRFGESVKTYGRDHGGHREGRRNFIEHTDYTDPDDGSKRVRVRFNLEGQYGTAFVFAEVSKDMPSGEFVYILVQDKRNGQVVTVMDNRSKILAQSHLVPLRLPRQSWKKSRVRLLRQNRHSVNRLI